MEQLGLEAGIISNAYMCTGYDREVYGIYHRYFVKCEQHVYLVEYIAHRDLLRRFHKKPEGVLPALAADTPHDAFNADCLDMVQIYLEEATFLAFPLTDKFDRPKLVKRISPSIFSVEEVGCLILKTGTNL